MSWLFGIAAYEEERCSTIVEQIKTCGTVIGAGLKEFITDRKKAITTVGGLTALAVGFYTAKRLTGFGAKYIEARLGKPSLVRETSCSSRMETFKYPIKVTRQIFRAKGDPLKGVVLDPLLESGFRDIAITTKNTNNGHLSNAGDVLFVEAPDYDMENLVLLTDIDEAVLAWIGGNQQMPSLRPSAFKPFPIEGHIYFDTIRFMVCIPCQKYVRFDTGPILNVWFVADTGAPRTYISKLSYQKLFECEDLIRSSKFIFKIHLE
uniref:ATPase family AAA domain-containing protein n=1 Tax=Panagrolaimus davidi TaxID=227884 RepID=A0A914Q708_9BILA